MRRLGSALLLLAGVAVGSAPTAAVADTCEGKLDKDASALYKGVMKQIDAGAGRTGRFWGATDWPELARKIEELLSSYPQPGHEALPRHGKVNTQYYLPHYYLGLCRYKSDDCDGALDAFLRAENAGCVLSYDVLKDRLRDMRSDCQTRPRGGGKRGRWRGPLAVPAIDLQSGSPAAGSPRTADSRCLPSTSGVAAW